MFEVSTSLSWLQGRHPFEMGSFAWIVGQVETHGTVAWLVASWVGKMKGGKEESGFLWSTDQLIVGVGVAMVSWWAGFGLMLWSGGRSETFNPLVNPTGRRHVELLFDEGSDFAKASKCFNLHPNMVSDRLRKRAQYWLDDGLDLWEKEKPAWFDEGFKEELEFGGYRLNYRCQLDHMTILATNNKDLRNKGRKGSVDSVMEVLEDEAKFVVGGL